MTSPQETKTSTKDNSRTCQKILSGKAATVSAEVADQDKIRLGGAFRLPTNKAR